MPSLLSESQTHYLQKPAWCYSRFRTSWILGVTRKHRQRSKQYRQNRIETLFSSADAFAGHFRTIVQIAFSENFGRTPLNYCDKKSTNYDTVLLTINA